MIYVRTGDTEPIVIFVRDVNGDALTALTDLYIRLMRQSDGLFYDWNDATFKASGWTTLNQVLTEINATRAAGLYQVTGGLATTSFVAGSYVVIPIQTPGINAQLPAPVELRTGGWVDKIYEIDTDAALTRKYMTNKQALSDGTAGNLVTYDDDDTAIIGTQDVTDKNGGIVSLDAGAPAIRSKAT